MTEVPIHADSPLRCGGGHLAGRSARWYRTPQYAMVYLSQGTGSYRDQGQAPVSLVAGDLVQRFPDHPHRFVTQPGAETWWLALPASVLSVLGDLDQMLPTDPVLHVGRDPDLARRFSRLAEQLPTADPLRHAARLLELMADLLARSQAHQQPTQRAEQAASAIERDPRLTIDAVASQIGCAPRTLHQAMLQRFGINPVAYRQRVRLEHTAQRLRDSTDDLNTIAVAVGWHDAPALCRAFKRVYGVSPGRWRTAQPTA